MSDAGATDTVASPAADRKEQQAQDLARAKDAGWTNPIPFQYDSVVGGTPAEDETRESAVWLSDAAIYQWDDDFGDVGEPNPELEKMLFLDEYLQRAGGAIKALSFDVTLEGPTKISPVRNVSHPATPSLLSMLMTTVRGCWTAPRHARECQALPVQCSDSHSVVLYSLHSDWQRCSRRCADWYVALRLLPKASLT